MEKLRKDGLIGPHPAEAFGCQPSDTDFQRQHPVAHGRLCYITLITQILEDYLVQNSITYLRMDGRQRASATNGSGNTKAEDRQQLLVDFNAPQSPYNVFILRYLSFWLAYLSLRFSGLISF